MSLFCCFLLNPHFVPQKNPWNHHEKPPYPYFPQKPAGTTHCPRFVSLQWWSPWLRLPLLHTWPSWGQWAPRRSRRRGAHSPPGARKRDGEFKKKRLKSTIKQWELFVYLRVFLMRLNGIITWVCLKIGHPKTQWIIITLPIYLYLLKWPFLGIRFSGTPKWIWDDLLSFWGSLRSRNTVFTECLTTVTQANDS